MFAAALIPRAGHCKDGSTCKEVPAEWTRCADVSRVLRPSTYLALIQRPMACAQGWSRWFPCSDSRSDSFAYSAGSVRRLEHTFHGHTRPARASAGDLSRQKLARRLGSVLRPLQQFQVEMVTFYHRPEKGVSQRALTRFLACRFLRARHFARSPFREALRSPVPLTCVCRRGGPATLFMFRVSQK